MTIINKNFLTSSALALVLATTGSTAVLAATTTGASPESDNVMQVDVDKLMPTDLASKLIGSEIYTADDEKIGDVNDLILDGEHNIVSMTVGVGGFLGIDETYVAVPLKHMTISQNKDKVRLSTDLTKADIEQAANKKQ